MDRVLITVLNMSIAGSIVALAVLLARLVLKRAPKWVRLALWGLLALRLAVPVFVQSPMSLMPRAELDLGSIRAAEAGPTSAPSGNVTVTALPAATDVPFVTAGPVPSSVPSATQRPIPVETVRPAPIAGTEEQVKPKSDFDWLDIASWVWLAGAAGMLAYAAISFIVLRKRLATAVLLEKGVYEADGVKTPFLLGLFRPAVYLPFGMDPRSRELVLLHERAHVRGLDHIMKPLGWAVLSVHWFNPLAWLAFALFSKDIELACDERVIRTLDADSRADYSEALIELSVKRRRISACPLAFGESNIKERVKNVLDYKKPALWVIIASAVIAVFITGCLMTAPKEVEEHDFMSFSAATELADEKAWVVIPDDYTYTIAKGRDEWNRFVNSVSSGKPAEVVLVTERVNPVTGKYSFLKDELGSRAALFTKVSYDGTSYTVEESSVYPLDFENRQSFDYFGRTDYPGGECWLYYLSDEQLTEIYNDESIFALYEGGRVHPLFKLSSVPVFMSFEDAVRAAAENGWVAVDGNYSCAAGDKEWNGFISKAEAGERAEVIIVTEAELATSSGEPERIARFTKLSYDGGNFIAAVCAEYPPDFGEPDEAVIFPRLEKLCVMFDDIECIEYAIVAENWFDVRSSWYPLWEYDGFYPLFTARGDWETFRINSSERLSDLTREGMISFLEENHICVDPAFRDESFDLVGTVKALESAPIVDIEGLTYYQEYDLRYAIGLYDGSVERPEKPILSHMGEEELMGILSEYSVEVPVGADLDLVRYDLITLENDVNKEYWSDVYFDDQYMLFEQLRWVVVQYYEKTGILVYDYTSRWNDYREAFLTFLATGNVDWAVPGFSAAYFGLQVPVSHEDGAFRAWERCRTYSEKLGSGDYTCEYEGLLAEYPAELWDICAEKLSNYHNEYLHWGWLPGQPYIGPYPDALICGEDSFLVVTEPWQDRQANVIMHRFADGEWREFGNSCMAEYPHIPTGFCITDDNTCFVCYKNRYEYVSSEGPHQANWVDFWASYDGGNTWQCLDLELPEKYSTGYPYPMAYSPVFEGERGVLPVIASDSEAQYYTWFLTEDGGHTWFFGGEVRVTNLSGSSPDDSEGLIDEAWVLAREAAEMHGVTLLKETGSISRYTGMPLTVHFTNADDSVAFEVWFTYDEETGEYAAAMDSCWLFIEAPEDIDGNKYRNDNDEVRPGGTISVEHVPEGGNIRGYEDAAEAIALLIAERFTGCSEDNYLRCENAFVAIVEQSDTDAPNRFRVCIVLDPVNEWFSGAFAGCMGPLYEDEEHPEWRGWYTMRFFLEVTQDDEGFTAELSWF